MRISINPGSGPVDDGTRQQSKTNIKQFIVDLAIPAKYRFIKVDDSGRHLYKVFVPGHESHEIAMPPLPLDEVRYIDSSTQNIWHFPRLYVDGSSWVWMFALGVCFNTEQ